MVGTSSVNERFIQVGREHAEACLPGLDGAFRLKLSLGYASSNQRLPWHKACHLAFAPLPGAGGPDFFAAGMYRVKGKELWFPLILLDEENNFSMNGDAGCLGDILGAVSVDSIFAGSPTVCLPPNEGYFSWLGFLVEVRNHPKGFPVIK